ncbi:uncharacterized protein PRCAT00001482001 [Priceomyces carsonii]|uniref:uncharacterized protein n=1 Tax=Priceomyces carsonii TaxID=28549 RepID=UPI002ED8DEBB|nr:unnamed protein product [Priceomyces carsonii]
MGSEKIIIVGTGLAGLTTALRLLQHGISVIMLEKGDCLGGNSIKASSGINGSVTKQQIANGIHGDSVGAFLSDSIRSGKGLSNVELLKILVNNSRLAIDWLTGPNLNIDLLKVNQLGGHSFPRTHCGSGKLPPGYDIVSSIINSLKTFTKGSCGTSLSILKNSSLVRILATENKTKVVGIEYENLNNKEKIYGDYVVLATGGFSADFASNDSLIRKFRPDLLDLPLTNSLLTTGDGQKIAERDVDAQLIQMDQVQVHPTGFIKAFDSHTKDEVNYKWKFLCGEIVRGIGAILVSPSGNRFVNELTTRDKVSTAIFQSCKILSNNTLSIAGDSAVAIIMLNESDYLKAPHHIDFYVSKGLMSKLKIADVYNLLLDLSGVNKELIKNSLDQTLNSYNDNIERQHDSFGRKSFGKVCPSPENSHFYVGLITPVLHFSMGGIKINEEGKVINNDNNVVDGLYAVGEISGGIHGGNRLGGNSLLECVVFGTNVAESIKKNFN